MRKGCLLAAVFILFFVRFSWRIEDQPIASAWVDPVGRIAAQDEAVYSHIAAGMARKGDWMTPRFMGRYALFKPPLLHWLTATSVRLFGMSNVSLRLPSILSAAGAATLAVAWALSWSPWAGLAVGLLLAGNPWLHTLARLNLMDALLTFFFTAAAWTLRNDPSLHNMRSRVLFGFLVAAGIMTKSIAGVLPLLMLCFFCLLARKEHRPSITALGQVFAVSVLLAAPWHLYQLFKHPHWFWAEYVVDEHFRSALAPLSQTSQEGHIAFYMRRWVRTDPVLLVLLLAAIPYAIGELKRRKSPEWIVLASWLATVASAILAFQYRNLAYLLPVVPAAALAGVGGALRHPRVLYAAVAVLAGVLGVRMAYPRASWGLSFSPTAPLPSRSCLDEYARLQRGRELVIAFPDDEFYSSLLPVPRVRYVFSDDGRERQHPAMDFRFLGITVSSEEFLDLPRWRPVFHNRLRSFEMDSDEPIATVIQIRSPADIRRLIEGAPGSDFFLPAGWVEFVPSSRRIVPCPTGRLFVFASESSIHGSVMVHGASTPTQSRIPSDSPANKAFGACDGLRER